MEYERIKSPKTNRVIYVYGDAYNKLLNEYAVEYLNSLPRLYTNIEPKSPKYKKAIKSPVNNVNNINNVNNNVNNNSINIMNNDVFNYTFLESPPNDFINLCNTNKEMSKFCTDELWALKLKKDYPIIKPKSANYKKEYIELTNLYQKAKDTLQVIKLYKEDHVNDFRYIIFLYKNGGFNKLDEIYWLPDKIKNKFGDAKRLRLMLLSTTKFHYTLLPINLETMSGPNINVSEKEVIELFWLLMYHYNIDIKDSGKDVSFLYDNLLKTKGKERILRLKYWKQYKNINIDTC